MMRVLRTLVLCGTMFAACLQAAPIKIATVAPDGSVWMREMRAGAEAVKQRTEGRVEFKFFPGGVMGIDSAVLRKIKLGQLQGGAFAGAELSLVYPDAQIYSLPFLFNNEDEVDAVRAKVDPQIKAGLEEKGMVALGITGGGFAYLLSTRPIKTKDDLQATKVWAPQSDRIAITTFEAGGVKPVALPIADVYTALSTGLVETVGNTPSGTIIFQWHTRIKHMVDFPLTYVLGYLAVDKKVFDKLAPEDQAIVRAEMDKAFVNINAANRRDNEAARSTLVKQGIELFSPGEKERQFWISVGESARERLLSDGAYSKPLFDSVVAALAEYRKTHAAGAGAAK
jgi:TRAP-type transport system periplasmic protein